MATRSTTTRNDVTSRDYLAEALELRPAKTAAKVQARIDPADERFRDATREAPGVIGGFYRHRSGWWWGRVPLVPGELVHDLPELDGDGSQEGSSGS